MIVKQKIKVLFISLAVILGSLSSSVLISKSSYADCGGVPTAIINCGQDGSDNTNIKSSGIWGILLIVINILTAGIGIAAVGGIAYGSVLYASAGGSPDQVKKARGIITNVVIGIIAYALMYSLLNFIIPGGIFT